MSKKEIVVPINEMFDDIFSTEQAKLMKRAVVKTQVIAPQLYMATLKIGNETNVMLFGKDANDNTHYTLMSEETFGKLKKVKV